MNEILRGYLELWRNIHSLDLGVVPKRILRRLLDGCNETLLLQIAEEAADEYKEHILLRFGKIDVEAVLEFIKVTNKHANLVQVAITDQPDGRKIVSLNHQLGQRWSKFSSSFLGHLFEIAGAQAKSVQSWNSVVFELTPTRKD